MSDYIDKWQLAEKMEWDNDIQKWTIWEDDFDSIPAADVAPVRHGRWIKPVPGDGENYCSVCHAEQPWFYGYGYYEPDYCPSCGARMDKEDGHEAD